ncbi:MAG: hypothetical protein H0Z32_07780 [Bacillaceae bacterium]|nr:hypothetical protein [Bacillaceae bacterium]
MVKILLSVVASILIISGCADNSSNNTKESSLSKTSDIENQKMGTYIDIIKYDNKEYANLKFKTVDSEDVGEKLGEVKFRVEGSDKPSSYKLVNGDATLLNEGTAFYQVKGKEGIAVKSDEGWILYEPLKTNEK